MIKNKKNRGLVVSLKNLICTALSSTVPMTTSDKVTLHKVIVLIDDMLLDKVKVTNTFLKEQSKDDLEPLKKMYVQAKCIEFSLILEGSPHAHVYKLGALIQDILTHSLEEWEVKKVRSWKE